MQTLMLTLVVRMVPQRVKFRQSTVPSAWRLGTQRIGSQSFFPATTVCVSHVLDVCSGLSLHHLSDDLLSHHQHPHPLWRVSSPTESRLSASRSLRSVRKRSMSSVRFAATQRRQKILLPCRLTSICGDSCVPHQCPGKSLTLTTLHRLLILKQGSSSTQIFQL